jgi:hypothetical protein
MGSGLTDGLGATKGSRYLTLLHNVFTSPQPYQLKLIALQKLGAAPKLLAGLGLTVRHGEPLHFKVMDLATGRPGQGVVGSALGMQHGHDPVYIELLALE